MPETSKTPIGNIEGLYLSKEKYFIALKKLLFLL